MDVHERQHIHTLFETKDYSQLYETQTAAIKEMLLIDDRQEFEDLLQDVQDEDFLDENTFWLYDSFVRGESLLIGGYDEDVTGEVAAFLKQNLPEILFGYIREYLHDLYVDLGTRDTLEAKIDLCNRQLVNSGYSIRVIYNDTYCAGVYFLSVIRP